MTLEQVLDQIDPLSVMDVLDTQEISDEEISLITPTPEEVACN